MTATHIYIDRERRVHPVVPVQSLPGRLVICRRTTDDKTLYLHESLLLPLEP